MRANALDTHSRRNHERRDQGQTRPQTPEELVRDAHLILVGCGVHMSPAKVSRLARSYKHRVEQNGFAFFDYLVNATQVSEQRRREALRSPDICRVIGYADPTGETAVRNVMRQS